MSWRQRLHTDRNFNQHGYYPARNSVRGQQRRREYPRDPYPPPRSREYVHGEERGDYRYGYQHNQTMMMTASSGGDVDTYYRSARRYGNGGSHEEGRGFRDQQREYGGYYNEYGWNMGDTSENNAYSDPRRGGQWGGYGYEHGYGHEDYQYDVSPSPRRGSGDYGHVDYDYSHRRHDPSTSASHHHRADHQHHHHHSNPAYTHHAAARDRNSYRTSVVSSQSQQSLPFESSTQITPLRYYSTTATAPRSHSPRRSFRTNTYRSITTRPREDEEKKLEPEPRPSGQGQDQDQAATAAAAPERSSQTFIGGAKSTTSTPRRAVPTPEYLRITIETSTYLANIASVRKLLILDLNGTLVFRSPHSRRAFQPQAHAEGHTHHHHHTPFDPYTHPLPPGTSLRSLRAVHPRPFMTSFRKYLFHADTRVWLDTMVWSSAQPHSVADMVDKSFGTCKSQLVAVWARDTLDLTKEEYNQKTQTTKNLEKPWAYFSKIHGGGDGWAWHDSAARNTHSAHTTILLDDSPLKAQLQMWNHVCIREYDASMRGADVRAAEADRCRVMALNGNVERDAVTGDGGGALVDGSSSLLTEVQRCRVQRRKEKKWVKMERKKGLRKPQPQQPGRSQEVEAQAVGQREQEGWDEDRWWWRFDCTLLAVVGILDAIKQQSNVASWIRTGGLSEVVAGYRASEVMEAMSREGGRTPQWFDDERVVEYWVERGVRALETLGVGLDPGVMVS
ncbi:hypothetical protein AMATHDRAFT_70071 [Amanita thiersii Skay4041]|uniref:FCP1 homology domain-containing protein n=1 Tax=Amanita thiersii Skay4041 TaxID=703135 RepID=A0A2A9NF90_9AGAR|nr:hypothetical protein AMATHDRAFT_70071 [Amanita thiersii Skay4041]